MALASLSDLEARMGVSLSGSDATRAQALLEDASAAAVAYTGQQFTPGQSTAVFNVRRGFARLGQMPVVSVDDVETIDGQSVYYRFEEPDRVYLTLSQQDVFEWEPFRTIPPKVRITYSHGGDVPGDIVAVVCSVAGRAFGVRPQDTAISQETIGQYNYSTGSAASSGAVGFLLPERAVLDRYVRHGGAVEVVR